jgi:hypothetical protein
MKRPALALFLFLAAAVLLASQRRSTSTGPANYIAQYVLPSQSRFTIAGRIEERLPAGSYVYVRVRDAAGASHWIVTLGDGAPGLDQVEATVYARAESFRSRRLGRGFSPLLFGTVHAAAPSTTSTNLGQRESP